MMSALLWGFANNKQKILLRSLKLNSQVAHSFHSLSSCLDTSELIKLKFMCIYGTGLPPLMNVDTSAV